jgi:predicted DCC family thiol-disulfide oxidoreductase YuxK
MTTKAEKQSVTCVFYDGACPLCNKEVKLYKKLAANDNIRGKYNDADIEWIDISKSQVELKEEGIKYGDAMQLMHVKDASGIHQVGVDAVLTVWDQIPYYRKLSKFLKSIPMLYPLLDRSYRFTAKHRMKITKGNTEESY